MILNIVKSRQFILEASCYRHILFKLQYELCNLWKICNFKTYIGRIWTLRLSAGKAPPFSRVWIPLRNSGFSRRNGGSSVFGCSGKGRHLLGDGHNLEHASEEILSRDSQLPDTKNGIAERCSEWITLSPLITGRVEVLSSSSSVWLKKWSAYSHTILIEKDQWLWYGYVSWGTQYQRP